MHQPRSGILVRGLIALWLFTLCGCAAQPFSMHNLPPERPAADNAAAISILAARAAAAARAARTRDASAPAGPLENQGLTPLTAADAPSMYTYDPWERVNRFTYRCNARFDENVFLPVANEYRRLPLPLRAGVSNFFGNLGEVTSTVNYLLQMRFPGSARSLARLVINSTLGVGGLFDVATKMKLRSDSTGFGATLSRWGMHPGPYLVIPLLGPATLRGGIGSLADSGIAYGINIANLYRGPQSRALDVVDGIDDRANVNFRYYGSGSPFEYETIRFLYVHKALIEDESLRARFLRRRANALRTLGH